MSFLSGEEREVAKAIAGLIHCNPFLPERIELEKTVLGEAFIPAELVWTPNPTTEADRPNIAAIQQVTQSLADEMRKRLVAGHRASDEELNLYQDVVFFLLYQRSKKPLQDLVLLGAGAAGKKLDAYRAHEQSFEHYFHPAGRQLPARHDAAHLYAGFFQIRRAFHFVFRGIFGSSMPAARLRGAVWQSIFTADMRRFHAFFFERMGDFATLIVGPTGAGKELVARAIGLSRFIPFNPRTLAFAEDFTGSFHALNLASLSPTLIESELFGHKRGSFTGAAGDRAGWLEICRPLGTVFLDEVGEIEPAIQVKLLRVLQARTFSRLGDTAERRFHGKLIAATNRDLAADMKSGKIREDFYYRLCSDIVQTPSLRQMLDDAPGDLGPLVHSIMHRIGGTKPAMTSDEEAALATEVHGWIAEHLGAHSWPGNFRELEQCVRNVVIRREYRPASAGASPELPETLSRQMESASLTADELLGHYCRIVYEQCGTYEETGRRLGLDRRTVKAKMDAVSQPN